MPISAEELAAWDATLSRTGWLDLPREYMAELKMDGLRVLSATNPRMVVARGSFMV